MINHLNSEKPPSLGESSRHGSVLRARRRIAARMVVDQNEGARRASDRFSKNLPWMHKARRECSSRHFFFCDQSMTSVQQEHEKRFPLRTPNARREVAFDVTRTSDRPGEF